MKHHFKKGKKEGLKELQTGEPHICAWQDDGTDPPGSNVKANARQGGELRQAAWLIQGQIVPDQYGVLL